MTKNRHTPAYPAELRERGVRLQAHSLSAVCFVKRSNMHARACCPFWDFYEVQSGFRRNYFLFRDRIA